MEGGWIDMGNPYHVPVIPLYRDLLAERCRANRVACWAYCLMPNHVHLVLTPADADALSRAVGEAHRRFTAFVNARARTTGHLF